LTDILLDSETLVDDTPPRLVYQQYFGVDFWSAVLAESPVIENEVLVDTHVVFQYQQSFGVDFIHVIPLEDAEVVLGIAIEADSALSLATTGILESTMPLFGNRVKETTTTVGTGTLDLDGAPVGFRAFADEFASADTVYYLIVDDPDDPTDYEFGIGTLVTGTPNTLTRDTVEGSSNSDAKVSFAAGSKTVINVPTAERFNVSIKPKTASYSVALDDYDDLITGDSSALSPATITITLPTVATALAGFVISVKNIGASGVVVIDGNGAETIDGVATLTLTNQYDAARLVCDGAGWLVIAEPTEIPNNFVLSAESTAPSPATSHDFASIPDTVKRITIQFSGVETDGADEILVQIGDAGGIETAGYSGSVALITGSPSSSLYSGSAGFQLDLNHLDAFVLHGTVVLTLQDEANFTWACNGVLGRSDTATIFLSGGTKSLTDTLDRVRVTTTGGTNSFDAGGVSILYE
jgi:hypothetical protein